MWFLLLLATATSTSAIFESFFFKDISGKCDVTQFTCRNSKCIPKKSLCDNRNDCGDNSDELDCDWHLCKEPKFFKCHNGRCIVSEFVCNDENDCEDFSDELHCQSSKLFLTSNSTCEPNQWECTDKLCIPSEWVCNGESDCLDGSDEEIGCKANIECDGFKCKNGQCLPTEWRCDGAPDCKDKSDEENCNTHIPIENCNLDNRKYLCPDNKTCIDLSHVCDKNRHCPGGTDEGFGCHAKQLNCSTYGCSHECFQLPTGPKCVCPKGYKTLDDKHCEDINECEQFGICHQKCRNTHGSYQCSCDSDYSLSTDKRTCKVTGGEAIMVFSSRNDIRGYMLESNVYFSMVSNLSQAVGVHYDGHHVYWTNVYVDEERIMRSLEDGSQMEALVTTGLGSPEDLAVDWLTGNIYFTDSEYKHIGVCSNDGSHCTVLLNKDIERPRGIALNVRAGDMYWTDWHEPSKIAYANMDGTNDKIFLSTDLHWPNSLALDLTNDRLYWSDGKKMTLESINLDGTSRKVILDGIAKHPYGIAVFEDRLYWSDWDTKSVESCDKFTGKSRKTVAKEKDAVYGLSIFHPSFQQKIPNPCATAFCSDLCLLKGSNGYTCACPQNKALGPDKHICRDIKSKRELIVGFKNVLARIEHRILGKHDIAIIPSIVKDIGALAYDSSRNVLLVSDVGTKKIISLNLESNMESVLDVSGLEKVTVMDYDSNGDNLYIFDEHRMVLEVVSLNTYTRKILLQTPKGEMISSIALVPSEGVMFVAFKKLDKRSTHLDKFSMDGTGRIHLIESGLIGPISLHYDRNLHRVFVVDAGTGKIETLSPEGTERHFFVESKLNPTTGTTLDNYFFWMNSFSKKLHWTEMHSEFVNYKEIPLELPADPEFPKLLSLIPKTAKAAPCNCSHLCLTAHTTRTCACPSGWTLAKDNRTCLERTHCTYDEFTCAKSNTCVSRKSRCDGRKDCPAGEDEEGCTGKAQACPRGKFQCANGDCIKEEQFCDHSYDCRDKSDEQDCARFKKTRRCAPRQFMCESGECVPDVFQCNGIDDCSDGSDERNCASKICLEDEFRCDSGACIPKSWECDKEFDCSDFSDEHYACASVTCPPTSFTCTINGRCIDRQLVCDNSNDCGDNSDEQHCHYNTKGSKCKFGQFACFSNTSVCLSADALCNGTMECPKGEDEEACSSCRDEEFSCKNKKCVAMEWICDKNDDCGDGSDEEEVLCSRNGTGVATVPVAIISTTCEDGFRCKSGQCLDFTQVCDGVHDCYDGSDEDGVCLSACKTSMNPCSQICRRTPSGPSCGCKEGYDLLGDGTTCVDRNECMEDPPTCAQLCHNKDGGYTCDCHDGFLLSINKKSCKAEGHPKSIIFAVEGQIREISHRTNRLSVLFTAPTSKIVAMDVLNKPRAIYFVVEGSTSIHRIDLETNTRHFVQDIGQPTALTLDWSNDNVYYFDGEVPARAVKVCNFDRRVCVKLVDVDVHKQVTTMAVDPVNKALFVVLNGVQVFDAPRFAIYRYNLDGSGMKEIVNTSTGFISGITYDYNNKHLYYMDQYSNTISRTDYEGTTSSIIYSNITRSNSLKFYEDHLYYSNSDGQVTKCKLFEKRICHSFQVHSYSSHLFTIVQDSLQPHVEDVCKGNNCSYFCAPSGYSYACLCPDGKFETGSQKCENGDSQGKMYVVHSMPINRGAGMSSGTIALCVLVPLTGFLSALAFITMRKKHNGYFYRAYFSHTMFKKHVNSKEDPHEYDNPVHFENSQYDPTVLN